MQVIKRNGTVVPFNKDKISHAILKSMQYGSGIIKEKIAYDIANEIFEVFKDRDTISIAEIETEVFNKLIQKRQKLTARAYEGYRRVREYQRTGNTIDKDIYGIVDGTNKDAMDENSNKNASVLSTQRDLIAGEFSRDYCKRMLLPSKIVQAHEDGIIHFHDMDYFIQPMNNCDLVNLKDMLANGTVINGKLIESPHTFQTACTIATQIVQQMACGQYGGQTISLAHLSPYVRRSLNRYRTEVKKEGRNIGIEYTETQIDAIDRKSVV